MAVRPLRCPRQPPQLPNKSTPNYRLLIRIYESPDNPFSMCRWVVEMVTIFTGVQLASRFVNGRAYVAAAYFLPNFLGVFLVNFLPWSNKVGLLFGQSITGSE